MKNALTTSLTSSAAMKNGLSCHMKFRGKSSQTPEMFTHDPEYTETALRLSNSLKLFRESQNLAAMEPYGGDICLVHPKMDSQVSQF